MSKLILPPSEKGYALKGKNLLLEGTSEKGFALKGKKCFRLDQPPSQKGLVCGFLVFWLQIAIEPLALFHHSVFDYMCFSVMFH